jgi:Protein of unknown function (DUF998)
MQLLTLPSRARMPHLTGESSRVTAARVSGLAGVVAYNWWVVVPFVPGLMPSVNGFFSDLEATGRPHAALMSDADMLAGALMIVALLLRGARVQGGARREWKWMVAFAAAGAIGGRFPYACSEGLSATCRRMEWSLQLPVHHYIHVVAGITEFVTLTIAVLIAARRTRTSGTPVARLYATLAKVLVVSYPLLGAVYLTDRLGTLVEPIFFVVFSVMVLAEVFESQGHDRAHADRTATPWAERVMARDTAT